MLLQTKVGVPFCTNVLRIALNIQEENCACVLVSKYKVNIDERMIVRAIKTAQMDFMKNLYFYNKNFERPKGF
jgi:hypothetical protein